MQCGERLCWAADYVGTADWLSCGCNYGGLGHKCGKCHICKGRSCADRRLRRHKFQEPSAEAVAAGRKRRRDERRRDERD